MNAVISLLNEKMVKLENEISNCNSIITNINPDDPTFWNEIIENNRDFIITLQKAIKILSEAERN